MPSYPHPATTATTTTATQGIRVTGFSVGFGPALLQFKGKDPNAIEYSLRAFPVGGFVSFPPNYNETEPGNIIYDDDPNLLQNRPPNQRAAVIAAGVVANIILAWGCLFTSLSVAGVSTPVYGNGVVVASYADSEASASVRDAGIRVGDVITYMEGVGNVGLGQGSVDDVVRDIRARPGQGTRVTVLRGTVGAAEGVGASGGGGTKLEVVEGLTVTPKSSSKVGGQGSLGIRLRPNVLRTERVLPSSLGEAASLANAEFSRIYSETFTAFVSILRKLLTGTMSPGATGGEALSGPVGVIRMGAEIARNDAAALTGFAAAISINLAIINSLPLPALDGGQMAFVLVEVARRKKVDVRVQENITGT